MKLNTLLIPVLSLALASTTFAGVQASGKAPAPAIQPVVEEPLGFTVTLGYDTNYIFRGVQFAEHLGSATIDYLMPLNDTLSLNLNAWYGASIGDHAEPFAGGGSYGELDLSASLIAKLGPVTAALKYTWYNYVGNAGNNIEDVHEVGVTLATALAGFDLGAGAYYDWTAEGWYFELGVSRTFAITDTISVVPGVLISAASHYYGVEGGNHIKPSIALPIKLCKTATLTPYIAGNLPYDSLDGLGEKSRFYGGIALSVTF